MMKTVARAFVLFVILAPLLAVPVYAKDPKKAVEKPTVVLLAVILHGEQSKEAMASYHSAVRESLQSQYKVVAGSKVEEEWKKVKETENAKDGCTQTACLNTLARKLNAGYVATVSVTKQEGDYILSLDVLDYQLQEVTSKTDTCSGCKVIQVVEKLKLLAGGEKAASPAVEPPAESAQGSKGAGGNEMELTYWNSIKESTSADDFAAYLNDYPKGKFVSLAKSRIAALKKSAGQAQESASKKAVEEASGKELAFWNSIKDGANPDDFAAYLQDYPKGTFASLAKSRMASLKKSAGQAQESATKKAADDASNKELAFWNSIKDGANPDDFAAYLQAYPAGTFALLAKSRIASLKKSTPQAQAAVAIPTPASARTTAASSGGGHEGMVYVQQGNGGFYMDKTEVTQEAYQRVIGSNPSKFTGCPTCPVEKVNWDEATAYCGKVGKRLPTEQEWEYAASGGKGETYAGTSNMTELGDYAWYDKNSGNKTHPVGGKKANGLGLYDMSGNVWEWTDSWYDDSKNRRVVRGGSWNSFLEDRLRADGRSRDWDCPFNCVSSLKLNLMFKEAVRWTERITKVSC